MQQTIRQQLITYFDKFDTDSVARVISRLFYPPVLAENAHPFRDQCASSNTAPPVVSAGSRARIRLLVALFRLMLCWSAT